MRSFNRFGKIVLFSLLCTMAFFGKSVTEAKAGVIEPGGEGYDDSYAIQTELDSTGKVKLVKGGTYYLYHTLILSSNMEIDATGATIICEKPIAFNIPDKANYKAAENISIIGGAWKSEGEGYQGSSFKFTHAKKIEI